MSTRLIAACAAAIVCAGPTVAATFATSFIDAKLTVATNAPVGALDFGPFPTSPITTPAAITVFGVGAASGEGAEAAAADGLEAAAQTTAAAPGDGGAYAYAEGISDLFIQNLSFTESYTIELGLTYSAFAEATTDGFPDDFAFATFGLLLEDFEGGFAPVEIIGEVNLGDAAIMLDDIFLSLGTVTLGPDAVMDLSLVAYSETGADSFGVVPLPAALPMMLAGLGALVALRRRA